MAVVNLIEFRITIEARAWVCLGMFPEKFKPPLSQYVSIEHFAIVLGKVANKPGFHFRQ